MKSHEKCHEIPGVDASNPMEIPGWKSPEVRPPAPAARPLWAHRAGPTW